MALELLFPTKLYSRACVRSAMHKPTPKYLIFCGIYYLLPLGLQLSTSSILPKCQTQKLTLQLKQQTHDLQSERPLSRTLKG